MADLGTYVSTMMSVHLASTLLFSFQNTYAIPHSESPQATAHTHPTATQFEVPVIRKHYQLYQSPRRIILIAVFTDTSAPSAIITCVGV